MSVEALGKDLLDELQVEGLGELLYSLRELQTSRSASLGFEPLDNLLNVFQNPPLTRQQQYQHTQCSTQHHASPAARKKPLPVIEITGASACSGKTQLLYYLIALSLLPAQTDDIPISGKESAVVLFDLSLKFSILRLYQIMHHHITSMFSATSSKPPEQEISVLISDSLTHLHIFRPHSSSSLLATLASLPTYLLSQPSTHFSTNRPLGLLALNDLTSFLWQDRLDAEEATTFPNNPTEDPNNNLLHQNYRTLTTHLRTLHHQFSTPILATTFSLSPQTTTSGHRALRPALPAPWNNFRTLNIIVERDQIRKFGPGMSAEEAVKEGPQRWEAVTKSGFSGWVNWWDSAGWREEVREGVKGLEMGGGFAFRVTKEGVEMGGEEA